MDGRRRSAGEALPRPASGESGTSIDSSPDSPARGPGPGAAPPDACLTDASLSVQPPLPAGARTSPGRDRAAVREPPLERVGHYRIEAEVGRGGMGVVYRAQDVRLGRTVAIKSLPVAVLDEPIRRARFEREAKLLALVNHPGIAAIHAVEEQDGRPFLILEYVPGESLAARLARGPLPPAEALAVARAIAEALEAAHGRGVVHRDLKPANVRITPAGEVKVLDFGLAKVLADETSVPLSPAAGPGRAGSAGPHRRPDGGPPATEPGTDDEATAGGGAGEGGEGGEGGEDPDLSITGSLLGSVGYMSPEQARGERIDRRADVWAFGCVLFELLTGAKLWGQGPAADRLRAIAEARPPLERLPPGSSARLRRLLERCLEKEPILRMEGMAEARREADACLAELGVGGTGRARPAGLPLSLSSFVGRSEERRELGALLEQARLVTLTGIGGVGKTRLALRLAEDLEPRFSAGVWYVDLAELDRGERVAPLVARAVGAREAPGLSLAEAIALELAEGDHLLVLDACQGVAAAAGALAASLLRTCAGLRVLATSRRPLGGSEEACFPVPPLAADEALELLRARAALQAGGPALAAGSPSGSALAEVVRRVAGVPLAIELAAARLRVLAPEQLAARLDSRLAALGRAPGPRHETLRDLVAWSYEGLSAPERLLLARLGVFAGSFTLESAEQVCAVGALREQDVLDHLMQLVDWSLVAVEKRHAEVRYRLLLPVREEARERLRQAGEATDLADRHLAHFLACAGQASRPLLGPEQPAWISRVELERDDLNAALDHAASRPQVTRQGLELAIALEPFWRVSYQQSEGRVHLERLLATGAAGDDLDLRERALNAAGWLARLGDDLPAAARLHREAEAAARATGSSEGRSRSLNGLGQIALQDGALDQARACWLERLALCRATGDRAGVAGSIHNLGNVEYRAGDLAAARAYREQALALARANGDDAMVASGLANLALLEAVKGGNHSAARAFLEESLALREKRGDLRGILATRFNLAHLALQHDRPRGRALFEALLEIARRVDARDVIAVAQNNLGVLALERGDLACARAACGEGLHYARRAGDRVIALNLLENLLRVDLAEGRFGRAARLLGAADAVRLERGLAREQEDQEEYERDVARLRQGLSDGAYQEARAGGAALGLEKALDEVLAPPGDEPGAGSAPQASDPPARGTS